MLRQHQVRVVLSDLYVQIGVVNLQVPDPKDIT